MDYRIYSKCLAHFIYLVPAAAAHNHCVMHTKQTLGRMQSKLLIVDTKSAFYLSLSRLWVLFLAKSLIKLHGNIQNNINLYFQLKLNSASYSCLLCS